MSTAQQGELMSVEDYLAGELVSKVKHEYLGGFVYAMAGARLAHNVIKGNIFAGLHSRVRGGKCRPYDSDTKIRVRLPTHVRFYYPDAPVVCHSNPQDYSFQNQPVLIVEVLSRQTRRTDEVEKKDAYLTIPSLSFYLLVEQEMPVVTAYRWIEQGFTREVYMGPEALIPLPELTTELPLAEIYEDVEFTPEEQP
ncbi:MAG: Uma2 family endonuclease [Pirellulales bacterium]